MRRSIALHLIKELVRRVSIFNATGSAYDDIQVIDYINAIRVIYGDCVAVKESKLRLLDGSKRIYCHVSVRLDSEKDLCYCWELDSGVVTMKARNLHEK